jgi:hypothetical protein
MHVGMRSGQRWCCSGQEAAAQSPRSHALHTLRLVGSWRYEHPCPRRLHFPVRQYSGQCTRRVALDTRASEAAARGLGEMPPPLTAWRAAAARCSGCGGATDGRPWAPAAPAAGVVPCLRTRVDPPFFPATCSSTRRDFPPALL